MNRKFPSNKQQGVTIVIVLFFLLIMTLLGVTALRGNVLNEKMTLNAIQRSEALEVAEIALLEAEALIENNNPTIVSALLNARVPTTDALNCETSIGGQGGLCVKAEADPSYDGSAYDNWRDIDNDNNSLNAWTESARHRTVDDPAVINAYNLTSAPKYIIEFMGFTPADGDPDNSGCATAGAPSSVSDQLNTWPYCDIDRSVYRITALATTGNYDETRVMLQATYVVDN
jgi:type IV pilus assembly protein PilX